MARTYRLGFDGAVAQLFVVYPELDVSILNLFKTMVNGALVE